MDEGNILQGERENTKNKNDAKGFKRVSKSCKTTSFDECSLPSWKMSLLRLLIGIIGVYR